MYKVAALLALGLGFLPVWHDQDEPPPNPEMQRQELINLEKETARAIQLNNGTFFRRVYSDMYSGTLSHGQRVNKAQLIDAVQRGDHKYELFNASDIEVRIFRDTALATCLWTSRGTYNGERIASQMRVIHVFVNSLRGWQVVASQATVLPPDTPHAL
jgi:ketosteroid isomerase-like protein